VAGGGGSDLGVVGRTEIQELEAGLNTSPMIVDPSLPPSGEPQVGAQKQPVRKAPGRSGIGMVLPTAHSPQISEARRELRCGIVLGHGPSAAPAPL